MHKNKKLKILFVGIAVVLQLGTAVADLDKQVETPIGVNPDALKRSWEPNSIATDLKFSSISIEKQIELLLALEFDINKLEDELNEVSKKKTWKWKSCPSLKQIFTWTKGALARLVDSRKWELGTVAVGAAFVVLGATFLYAVSDGGKINLSDLVPLLPQNLVTSVARNTGKIFFITLCHELGHALMNYSMNGHASDVYLGESPEGEFLEILPGVQLHSLDPYSPAGIKANIADMISLPAEEAFIIKKTVLLELVAQEGTGGRSLEELKSSSEYADRVAALTYAALENNRKKLGVFYAAGPVAAFTSIAAFKALSGESLMMLNPKDLEELFNLLPWNNSDGFNIIAQGFGRPDIAARAQKIIEKIMPYACSVGAIGYVGKMFHACNVFNQFPGSVHNVISMIGNTFRALRIAAINVGSLGMIYVEPVAIA